MHSESKPMSIGNHYAYYLEAHSRLERANKVTVVDVAKERRIVLEAIKNYNDQYHSSNHSVGPHELSLHKIVALYVNKAKNKFRRVLQTDQRNRYHAYLVQRGLSPYQAQLLNLDVDEIAPVADYKARDPRDKKEYEPLLATMLDHVNLEYSRSGCQ